MVTPLTPPTGEVQIMDESLRAEISAFAEAQADIGEPAEHATWRLRAQWFADKSSPDWESNKPLIDNIIMRAYEEVRRKRKKLQHDANRAIANGRDAAIPTLADVVTVEEALDRFVYVMDGAQVFDAETLRVMTQQDFVSCYAASLVNMVDAAGKLRTLPVAKVWLSNPNRKTIQTVTYRPSADAVTASPDGVPAMNLWRRVDTTKPSADWAAQAAPFIDHISWVFGDAAKSFLDWLAHIEQRPGELPHFGFLHIARHHGVGRNFISKVLTRVWPGKVAPAFDLVGALESGYNARLSGCHLAVVDEIYEGGSSQWKYESALRQLMTADRRLINPKYGLQRTEYNVCRFLLFSNHKGALPLDANDRRWYVVNFDGTPKDEDYYTRLYELEMEAGFIDSVRQVLRERDIAAFNPGQRPPMTAEKLATVDASRSEADRLAMQLAQNWPVDVIFLPEVEGILGYDVYRAIKPQALTHSLDRAGIQRYRKSGGKLRYVGAPVVAYVIRNFDRWAEASAEALRQEQARVGKTAKDAALWGEEPPHGETTLRHVPVRVPAVLQFSSNTDKTKTKTDLRQESVTVGNGNRAVTP